MHCIWLRFEPPGDCFYPNQWQARHDSPGSKFHKFSGGSISQRNLNFFRISLRDPGDASIRVLFRLPWPIKFIINRLVSECFYSWSHSPSHFFHAVPKTLLLVYPSLLSTLWSNIMLLLFRSRSLRAQHWLFLSPRVNIILSVAVIWLLCPQYSKSFLECNKHPTPDQEFSGREIWGAWQ